eukprot:gene17020-20236_t
MSQEENCVEFDEPNPDAGIETMDTVPEELAEELEVDEEDDDNTPQERPGAEVAASDAVKAKSKTALAKDKSINWGVEGGTGGAVRTIKTKVDFFEAVEKYNKQNRKWPNQTSMVALAKALGIKASYSTLIDQIRYASTHATERRAKLHIMDGLAFATGEHKAAMAAVTKLEKDSTKYSELDTAALSVQEAKTGKSFATRTDNVRTAVVATKKEAHSLRERVNNDMREQQQALLDKNKRLLAVKQEE